jgi:hypothetical protein
MSFHVSLQYINFLIGFNSSTADWEPTYDPEIADMTLKQYAQSKLAESNWMTRALSNAGTRNVTEEHLKAAMDIIRRKFLVGLLNRKDESMERYEKYFEWIYRVHPKNQEKCRLVLFSCDNFLVNCFSFFV